jgi:carbonic anhydrase
VRKSLLVLVTALITAVTYGQDHHSAHWSYEGETGPRHWADLNPAYSLCQSGQQQSPINIVNPVTTQLPEIEFHYQAAPLKLIDNGHTVQVNYPPGSYISVGGKRYELLQFHFHHPSEEQLGGKPFDLVIHLVHKDATGNLAVVAVLFTPGASNPAIRKIVVSLPSVKGHEATANTAVDASSLLPSMNNYYTFAGSLTTPPCTEGVTWYVLQTPSTLSTEELNPLAKLYPHNARPIQPLNSRTVRTGK